MNASLRGFIKSGPYTLIQFQWNLLLIRGPTGTGTGTGTAPALLSQQYTVCLGCQPFVLQLRFPPSQIGSTVHTYTGILDGSD
jgi:hypothetical protein